MIATGKFAIIGNTLSLFVYSMRGIPAKNLSIIGNAFTVRRFGTGNLAIIGYAGISACRLPIIGYAFR